MIQPTIGRQVWFWPAGSVPGLTQSQAATVCCVHSDRLVNLRVIDHVGEAHPQLEVRLRQPEDDDATLPFCEWMPYQKGQAAKTEQLEAAAKS